MVIPVMMLAGGGGGMSSLYEAAMAGDVVVVKGLMESNGKMVHELDAGGWSALHWAAARGHNSVVACLLDHGE